MRKLIQFSKFIFAVTIMVFGMVFSNGCTQPHVNIDTDSPSWYFSPKADDCCITSVGMGDSRAEALVNALAELAATLETSISSMSKTFVEEEVKNTDITSRLQVEQTWGPVTIKSMMKDYSGTVSGGGFAASSSSLIDHIALLTFESGDKKQLIKLNVREFSEEGESSYSKSFEYSESNSTLEDIIAALESEGIKMTWDDCGKNHFVRMDFSKKLIEDRLKDGAY